MTPETLTNKPRFGTRLLGMASAGLIAGLLAVGAANVAQAQNAPTPASEPELVQTDELDEPSDTSETEEDAIWERFDQCLADQGIDIDALEQAEDNDSLTPEQETQLDAALDACDPILDALPEESEDLEDGDFEDEDFEDCDDPEENDFEDDDDPEDDDFEDEGDDSEDGEESEAPDSDDQD